MVEETAAALGGGRNVLMSGGTGSGKARLLNALVSLLPTEDRVISIEDTLELGLTARQRPPIRDPGSSPAQAGRSGNLVQHALRHRPEHVVVGEVHAARPLGHRPLGHRVAGSHVPGGVWNRAPHVGRSADVGQGSQEDVLRVAVHP